LGERTKEFYAGREFDPVKVGVDTTASAGTFLMDTTLLGNSPAKPPALPERITAVLRLPE
jgi:hypothetical protein